MSPVAGLTATDSLTLDAVELERRRGDGQRVRLLWVPEVNEVLVEQLDLKTGELTLRQAPAGQALEAFNHPSNYGEARTTYSYRVVRGEIEDPHTP